MNLSESVSNIIKFAMNNYQPNIFLYKNQATSSLLSLKNDKYIPNPQAAQIILKYFIYRNYQDFNTWQQIARVKSDFQFLQNTKGTHQCRMQLKWQDKSINPTIHVHVSQGRNKKEAKKKVLQKMIRDLMIQGYISKGFKESDFLKKLPRRRKQQSSESQQEQAPENLKTQSKIKQLLIQNDFKAALGLTTQENFLQIWHFALTKRSLRFCKQIILALQNKSDEEQMQLEQNQNQDQNQNTWQENCKEQPKKSQQEGLSKMSSFQIGSRYDDLTDFLQYYQLQWENYQETLRGQVLQWTPIPSETIRQKYVKRQDLFKQFFPIEKTLDIQNHYIRQTKKKQSLRKDQQNPYFKLPYRMTYPIFQESFKISLRTLQILYDSLLFYAYDLKFCQQVVYLLNDIKQITIKTSSKKSEEGEQIAGKYFLKHKALLLFQFLSLISLKLNSFFLSIEGMIIQTTGKSANTLFTFTPKQPQEYVSQKMSKKTNTNEFQQSYQITVNQYVLLVSKIDPSERYIAYIQELSPNIKILSPQLPFQLNTPKPFTLYKITNAKLYQRTSNALNQVCKYLLYTNPTFFQTSVRILLQPPINNSLNLIIQLACQLAAQQSIILLVSSSADLLYEQLTKFGFRCAKITPKFDDKSILKTQIVCSSPNAICSEVVKNYTFQKVIIDQAHQFSQIMIFSAISKGCKKLFLIGDTQFPKVKVLSKYCQSKGMDISLMQRLIRLGHPYCTYYSVSDQLLISPSILEWPNSYFYRNQVMLKIAGYHKSPIVKGFPWPIQDARVSFIDISTNHINSQISCAIRIILSLLHTGFIQLEQICCLVNDNKVKFQLGNSLYRVLKEMYETQENLANPLIIDKIIKVVDGQRPQLRQFSIVITGDSQWKQECLNVCFFYAKRGIVFLGDANKLKNNQAWTSFLTWCDTKKVILRYKAN